MKLGYTIIYVASVPDTLAFYQKAFGLKLRFLHDSEQYGELSTGETTLAFASHEMAKINFSGAYAPYDANQKTAQFELAFVTEHIENDFQTAIDAGCESISAPSQKPWGQMVAYVRAPEGTLIELCSPMS